jgi:hypothetical protein
VFIPVGHSPDVDLIASFGGDLVRAQVKTCIRWASRRWDVQLCTRGGNQSWQGLVKRLDPSACDALFVHVGDGRRWYIPSSSLGGSTGVLLGGPKYAEFEVEPGDPLPARTIVASAASS